MGRATVEALHDRGANVIVLGRSAPQDQFLAERGIPFRQVDVTDFTAAELAVNAAADELGGLDIAVNTPGLGIAQRTVSKNGPHSLDDFRSLVDVNLVAVFNLNRLQAWRMAQHDPDSDGERGVIINTGSIASDAGQIGQVAYAASKAGLAGLTLTMSRDLGSLGIRVLSIAPSAFRSGQAVDLPQEMEQQLSKDAPFPKRFGRPHEYAQLAVALIENSMMNGCNLRLDGGLRLAPT
jgi:NAD(P)-dependent dehydrogenase (short-subunit alcohol dehydrogenase family)